LIPVHATVDNAVENVVYQLQYSNKVDSAVTTQRIDINTSGLLVVATYIPFAAYFAEFEIVETQDKTESRDKERDRQHNCVQQYTNIKKGYKCLVCLHATTILHYGSITRR
jgi:hypothetical protein